MSFVQEPNIEPRLSDLHGTCELNYVRLCQLFPEMQLVSGREFRAGPNTQNSGVLKLSIKVLERSPYTTQLSVEGAISGLEFMGTQSLKVYVYHDAKMAEVTHCDEKPLRYLRYVYPNQTMFQSNEKSLMNEFLSLWLEQVLAKGFYAEPLFDYSSRIEPKRRGEGSAS